MSTPQTMKAWQRQPDSLVPVRVELPIPAPDPDSLLLRVLAAGVCHSDSTILALPAMPPGWNQTFVMGHEGCGEVVSTGSNVDASQFRVGDRVAVMITAGCQQRDVCGECSRGLERLCHRGQTYGLGHDGVFAEYLTIKQWAAVRVPDGVSHPEAAIAADAALTAYHAVKHTAALKAEHTVVIFGLGGVGLNAVQVALHLKPARLIVVDKRAEAVEAAVKLGVAPEDAICSATHKVEEKIATEGIVVDTVIDFVGTQDSFTSAQYSIRPGGTLVQVGLIGEALTFVNVPTVMRELNIKCSYNGTIEGLRECLDLMSKGIIKPSVETGKMEQVPQVIRDLDDGLVKGRMVLLPD